MPPKAAKANPPGSKFKAAQAQAAKGGAGTGTSAGRAGAAGAAASQNPVVSKYPHLFEEQRARRGIGQGLPGRRNLSRYVRWPRYIRLQRQRAILKQRINVPPAINQFTRTLDKNAATTLFRLLAHYRPESKIEKKQRLQKEASEQEQSGKAKADKGEKPMFIKYGLNHVTTLIESKRARLVIIAHDVDPMELVVWLPALCRKMGIPYCIVRGKSRLGQLVYKKNVTAIAVTDIRPEDRSKLDQIAASVKQQFNDDATLRRKWGGNNLGHKAQHALRKREHALREASRRLSV